MRRTVSNLLVIGTQLLIVGLFFTTVFTNDIKVNKHVSIIHNDNLDKIATSVSLLFEEEDITSIDKKLDDMTLEELPSLDKVVEDIDKEEEKIEENSSEPLYSIDASKYINNEAMGFVVTEGNKEYSLSDYEFDVVVAVVAAEYHNEYPDDALGVVSVILNRCDSDKWVSWAGSTPYSQVITKGQFEVYFTTNESISYKKFMPGGSKYGSSKYEIAKQAVLDGFNGIRNNSYLGFRSGSSVSYSDYYIVPGGNRYGYN